MLASADDAEGALSRSLADSGQRQGSLRASQPCSKSERKMNGDRNGAYAVTVAKSKKNSEKEGFSEGGNQPTAGSAARGSAQLCGARAPHTAHEAAPSARRGAQAAAGPGRRNPSSGAPPPAPQTHLPRGNRTQAHHQEPRLQEKGNVTLNYDLKTPRKVECTYIL